MSLTKLGVFANMVLAATAVLLPPTMDIADLEAPHTKDVLLNQLLNAPSEGHVSLNCDDCPYATKDDERISWTETPLDSGNTFVSTYFACGDDRTGAVLAVCCYAFVI